MPETITEMPAKSAAADRDKPSRAGSTKHRMTKRDRLIRMLSAPNGAGAEVIGRKFGWLPHTTRAAVSGLRTAGLEIQSEKSAGGKPTRYRIIARGASRDAQ